MNNLRASACLAITAVIRDGRSLNDSLAEVLPHYTDQRDQGLLQEIAYGSLRHRWRLAALRDRLLRNALEEENGVLANLILVGLYQLLYLRVADHAAVNETVNACVDLGEKSAKGLINAILRRAQREHEKLLAQIDRDKVVRYSHPKWLVQALQAQGAPVEQILEHNNLPANMCLRVNRQRQTRDAYLQRLLDAGLPATAHTEALDAVVLLQPCNVEQLPGFSDGDVSVQDAAAQLTADYLLLQPNLSILDACAAPGGKTAHMLEREPSLKVIAVDHDAERLQRVSENLQRLHLTAQCIATDAADVKTYAHDQLFDRILLDAPCSATGVIRRHPDIKSLRRPDDIAQLSRQQFQLLKALWPHVKPGGYLLYATCSVMKGENEGVIKGFLNAQRDALLSPLSTTYDMRQIWPGEQGMDGFFYCRLQKQG